MANKKRGEVGPIIYSLIGIVLAAILILFVLKAMGIIGAIGAISEQESMAGWNNLAIKINQLSNSPDYFKTEKLEIKLEDKGTIVAFNKDETYSIDACYDWDSGNTKEPENIPKPKICGRDACLCYYKPGDDANFEDNALSKEPCKRLPKVDYIISFFYVDWIKYKYFERGIIIPDAGSKIEDYYGIDSTVYKNMVGSEIEKDLELPSYYPKDHCVEGKCANYTYFFLYGQCDGWEWDQNFGKNTLYIEKFVNPENDKTYILVAGNSDKEVIKKRANIKKEVEKIIKKEPQEYLALINKSFQEKNYTNVKELAGEYKIHYGDDPKYANITIVIYNYLDRVALEEKTLAQVNQQKAAT